MTTRDKTYKGKRGKFAFYFKAKGETITQLKKDEKQVQKMKAGAAFLAAEKEKLRKEREEKQKLLSALAKKPHGVKMKQDKDGNYYYQPRNEKGHLMPRVNLTQ